LPSLNLRFRYCILVLQQGVPIPQFLLFPRCSVLGPLVSSSCPVGAPFSLASSGVQHGTDLSCHFFFGMTALQAHIKDSCNRSAILSTSSARWRVVALRGPFPPASGLFETLPDSCSRVVTPFLRVWRSTLFIEIQARLQDTVIAGGYIYIRSPINRIVWKV
jgi:hypothetical protein